MNFRIAYWSIVSYSLVVLKNAMAEKCDVNYTDAGESRLMCFNVKDDGAAYNETLAKILNLTQIQFLETELSEINPNFFEKFALFGKIRWLTVSHGNLTLIDENNFGAFEELLHLNLSFNRISSVSAKAFAGNVLLRSVSLMSNEIEQLKANTFSTLVDLESVDLTRNYLGALDKHLFSDNVNLVNLDLKFNSLKEISGVTFHALPDLESLDLSYNRIEVIPPHVFKYNYALSRLNLQGNAIKCLDFAFVHLGLSELNLLENPLDMGNEKNRRVIRHLKRSNVTLKAIDITDYREDDAPDEWNSIPGEVVLKTSPQLRLALAGIITLLIIIMALLSFLLYHVHRRSKQKLHEQYYHNSCRSIDCLRGEEHKCLSLSLSEGNAFFRNCQGGRMHTNEDRCSCVSCFDKRIDASADC